MESAGTRNAWAISGERDGLGVVTASARPRGLWRGSPSLRLAFGVMLVGSGAGSFANTLLTASLEPIAKDLDTTIDIVSWMQVAPFLVFAVGMPIFGKLCDLIGSRRVYLSGLALSLVGNALTSVAPGVTSAIAFRTLAQLGIAAIMPAGFKLVSVLFEGDLRTKRIAAFNATTALSPVIGAGIGGKLIEDVGWRAPFGIQSVLLSFALVAAVLALPETPRATRVRFDIAGAVLLAGGVGSSLFVINRLRAWGPLHPVILTLCAVGPALLLLLSQVERRRAEPLMPLQYLALPDFRRLLAVSAFTSAGYFGATVAAPIALTRLFGFDTSHATYVIMIRPLTWSLGAWLAPRLASSHGTRTLQVVCNVMQAASLLVCAAGVGRHWLVVFVAGLAWHGLASGAAQVSVLASVATTVSTADAGIGNGVLSMFTMIGTATGTTLTSVVISGALVAMPFALTLVCGAVLSALVAGLSWRLGREGRLVPVSPQPAEPALAN